MKLLEYLGINKHTINLEIDKKLFNKLIYNLESIKLETLKINIKTN